MPFDVAGARSAGYSDAEIASFLAKQTGFDVDGAVKAGYKPAEIVDYLGEASNKGPIPQDDPLTRVDASTPASDSVAPVTPVYDAGAGRGRINPPMAGEPAPQTSGSVLKDVAINAFGGAAGGLAHAGSVLADTAGASDTAQGLEEIAKNWAGLQKENGGDTLAGKAADIVGGVAPAFVAPAAKLAQFAVNAGLFGVPGFKDTLQAQLDKGASFPLALAHAVASFGVNMAMPTAAKYGGEAVGKILGTEALGAAGKAIDTAGAGAVFGALTAGGSAADKAIDVAAGAPNDNPWVDAKNVAASIIAGSAMHGARYVPEAANAATDAVVGKVAPNYQAAREMSRTLDEGQFSEPTVETLNPNLARVEPAEAKTADPITKIARANSVDEAIAAAQEAVSSTPVKMPETPEVPSGPTIEQLLAQTKAKTSGLDADLLAARPLETAPEAAPEVPAETATEAATQPATTPEAAPATEPAVTWFGRAGDGYKTVGDAQMALPSRLKVAPTLDWKVEPMPNGKFRLAGYEAKEGKAQDAARELPSGSEAAPVTGSSDASSAGGAEPAGAMVGAARLRGVSAPGPESQRRPDVSGLEARDASASEGGAGQPAESRSAAVDVKAASPVGQPTGDVVARSYADMTQQEQVAWDKRHGVAPGRRAEVEASNLRSDLQALKNRIAAAGFGQKHLDAVTMGQYKAEDVLRTAQSDVSALESRIQDAQQRAEAERKSSELAPEVSRYNGKYGKGMGRDAARLEAQRLNRLNDGVTYSAEEHGDPSLENPYAVVGRRMGHELPDARAIDTADAERALNDIPREADDFTKSGGVMERIAQQGYEKAEVPRVQAARRLSTLLDRYNNNKISEGMFQLELQMLAHRMTAASEAKQANRVMSERERGADLVREKLIRARRQGDLDHGTVDFGLWLLDKNPDLASDLGASVRSTDGSSAGRYNPAARVITLFKGRANEGTAVHEILHHSERMMPTDVQKGIADAWSKAYAKAYKEATPEQRAALDKMVESMAGSRTAHNDVIQAFKDRTLDYDKHYQLTNPSEYWAVNATRIMQGRFEAKSWAGKAKQWLGEMIEKAKGAFGLSSDAPIIKGLKSVLEGDGNFQSKKMLSQGDQFSDIKGESDEERTARLADKVGAGYHAYAGVERVPRKSTGSISDSIAKALVPAGRKDASITSGIIRANLGEQAREREVAQQKLMEFAKSFDKMPVAENYKFIDAMERGVPLKDPEQARAAVALRKVLDERRDQVIALGKGNLENFNENYFPHIWKDKTAASNFFTRRPLEGGKGFLKQRTYDYFSDGLKAGLEPVTTNPVELAMLKAREMDRYIYGQRIFQEMKDAGVAKFVGFGQKAPDGWQKINDKIARVMQYSETEKGMILRGEYYAPEQAATLINNHLSPGLSGVAAFDMIRKAGNMMNATQLGLSAFHLGFTTLDAMISKAALGVKQATRGDVLKGIGSMAQSLNPAQPVVNLIKGDKLLKAYLGSLNDPELAPIVEALVQAGGRVKMDDVYRNAAANEFRQAVRKGNYGTAAMKVLPRMLDLINKPIFEYLVPRQKLGVFFDMAKDALESNPDMSLTEKRQVMGKLWDSVDNRMGELVYDNVFWNRALKDAMMVSVRSVGWNLGTFREIGGGIKDIKDIPKIGGLSDRTSYIFALTFVTSVIGSLTQYLMTGEGPKELKDVFFPRTGKVRPDGTEDRLSLPSYMKDIFEYGHDLRNFAKYGDSPFNTLENKLHPLISTMAQIFTNKDFFGGAIRSPGDAPMQQVLDEANYMLKQFTPFSLRNYMQQAKVKGEEPSVLGYVTSPSMIGITPAPGYITKSDEQAESAQVSRMRDALVTKFREEMRDGADWAEVRARAMDAGLRGQDLEFIKKSAVQRPAKKLKAFATH